MSDQKKKSKQGLIISRVQNSTPNAVCLIAANIHSSFSLF